MSKRDFGRIRTTLLGRREQLLARVSVIQDELRAPVVAEADTADQASASYDKNALHQQLEQANGQLRMLDESVQRIDAGTYGECVMCGKEIAMARLEALPWARYCVDCQEFQESLR